MKQFFLLSNVFLLFACSDVETQSVLTPTKNPVDSLKNYTKSVEPIEIQLKSYATLRPVEPVGPMQGTNE